MKKVLVPTDFSTHSRAGIRFAIRWAGIQNLELVFVHVLNVLRPTRWDDEYYAEYARQEVNNCRANFERFITGIYRQINMKPGKHSNIILHGIRADISILEYCEKKSNIDYICISTRGAGKIKKVFGTNTANLIAKSPVPVLAVPENYKAADIQSILYATDLRGYDREIKRVFAFSRPLKAPIDVVHFTLPEEIVFDEKTVELAFKRQFKHGVKLHLEKNGVHSFVDNLEKQIKIRKPGVVVMFTNQERTFFQRLFQGSKSEEVSFRLKTPLLVFNKN